jgi:hypothetical protein
MNTGLMKIIKLKLSYLYLQNQKMFVLYRNESIIIILVGKYHHYKKLCDINKSSMKYIRIFV